MVILALFFCYAKK